MAKLKEYKGVSIYVTDNGEFYCNVETNSELYREKTFNSSKVSSIEKAIDNYKGVKLDKEEYYYYIETYSSVIKRLDVVSVMQNRKFFNDGTDTSSYNRKSLFESTIENTDEFIELEKIFQESNELREEITKLNKKKSVNHDKSRDLVNKLRFK